MEPHKNISTGEIIVYKSDDKSVDFQVLLDDDKETFWATEQQIAELFKRDRTVINRHIGNIFKGEELNKDSVSADFAHTANMEKLIK